MSRTSCATRLRPLLMGLVLVVTTGVICATAGEHRPRRGRRAAAAQPVPTAYRNDPVYGSHLGTFYPTPAVMIQGNYPVGGGYSPLGIYGEHAMSLYGPFSSFRVTTAPVLTYTRGYDGVVRPSESISTSTPMLPRLSPLAYPTRANNYYAPRVRSDPAGESAINWLDQN